MIPTTNSAPDPSKRLLVLLVALFVLCAASCRATEESAARPEPPAYEVGREVTVVGTVTENDRGCEADLYCLLHLDAEDGPLEVVYAAPYPRPCPNEDATEAGLAVEVGDRVEVFARVTGERALSTCADSRYSITVLPPGG
jgi:hypothetical protein